MGDQKYNFCASNDSKSFLSDDYENCAKNDVEKQLQNNADQGSFSCDTCKSSFSQFRDLKRHSRVHLPFKCDCCQKGFSTMQLLKKHEKIHEGPFVCRACDKSFSKKCNLKMHLYTHSMKKPYVCVFCNRGFTYMNSLKRHCDLHTCLHVQDLCSIVSSESYPLKADKVEKPVLDMKSPKKAVKPCFWDTLRKGFSKSYLKDRRQTAGKN